MRHTRPSGLSAAVATALLIAAVGCGDASEALEPPAPLEATAALPMALPWGKVIGIETSTPLFFLHKTGLLSVEGASIYGEAGIPEAWSRVFEPTLVPGVHDVVQVSTRGGSHTCARSETQVWCWGRNSFGQLANPQYGYFGTPSAVEIPLLGWPVEVLTGGDSVAVILKDGSLWRWGRDFKEPHIWEPTRIDGLPAMKRILFTWWPLSCAIDEADLAWCWGDEEGFTEILLDPPAHQAQIPVRVPELDHVVSVRWTIDAFLLLRTDGTVVGRGDNGWGCLGIGDKKPHDEDYVAASIDGLVVKLETGSLHACALLMSGEVYCWGDGYLGKLGQGSELEHKTPVMVKDIDNVVDIGSSSDGMCALRDDGNVFCWGDSPVVGTTFLPQQVDLPSLLRTP